MKKKVVFIAEALGGGVRRHLVDLLENLNKDFYEIYVIYGSRTDSVFFEKMNILKEEGIVFYEVRSLVREISFKMDFKAFQDVYRILKQVKPDIVHCHSSKAGALGRICAKTLGIRQIYYTPHAYAFMNPNISALKGGLYLFIEKVLGFFMTKAIHVSKGEEKFALEHNVLASDKSTVIYNGIKKNEGIHKKNAKKANLIVGTVARMDVQKNPLEFVKIAERVIENHPEVTFVYVGDGEMFPEVEQHVAASPYKENILLTGFQLETLEKLRSFDIFLTTSLYEGLPYSLIEAISLGVPVVATDIIGNNEVVNNHFNGYLYQQGEVEEAASIIHKLCMNREKLEEISQNSLEWYARNFLLENMIRAHEDIYNAS